MISHALEPSQATFVFYCILFYSFLFFIHPALIAVIHASGNLPSFRSNDSSPRDSKPHMVTLLRSHLSVFCNLFRATSATPNVFRPGEQEVLFNPSNHTDTDDLGSLAHDFQVMLIFFIILLFTHSQQGIRGTPCTANHTSVDFTQSQLPRMVRAASLV